MNVGDKVRFTHGKEQGVVRRIVDARTIEVEIEDGFLIPVLKNEVVRIASEEKQKFSPHTIAAQQLPISATDGVFLSFDAFNDRIYSLYLLNDSNQKVFFTASEQDSFRYQGIASGIIDPRTYTKIGEYKLAEFESWPELIVQLLIYTQGESTHVSPLEKKLKFNAVSFHKSKRMTKLLNRHTFLFQLDRDAIKIEPSKILDQIEARASTPVESFTKPNIEVDLHIEKLSKASEQMQPQEMLYLQINEFEKSLENAIASGMEQIVFIHGSGNGTLKNEIHKRLSKNKVIKFFKDAQKEKFGYGATLVQLN